ncbi:MAG: nuclear transport factor 2 family protein [Pseudomonadota bacterium]
MKKFVPLFSLLLIPLLMPLSSFATEPAARVQRVVPTVTRTVQLFSTLENEWIDAVQSRDVAAIKKILAEDFELRSASAPGRPTPREESISRSLQDAPFTSDIEQMAAHDYGNTVVVSFLWKLDVAKSSSLPHKIFVVDTWKQVDGNWRVSTRYAAPVEGPAKNVPGMDPVEPTIKKKI